MRTWTRFEIQFYWENPILLVEFNTESKRKVIRWSWIEHFGKIAQKQVQTKPFLRWRPCRRHIVVLQCHHHNFLVKHPSNYRHKAQDLPNNQVVARWNLLKYDKLFRMIIVITWENSIYLCWGWPSMICF